MWKPIDTAPKESRFVDGHNHYADHILVWHRGYDFPMRARWWFREGTDACNFIQDGGMAIFPSHWMPLPDPPQEKQ